MARERYGNGYKGRAATRRRMRSRDRGYVGSEKARGLPFVVFTPCRPELLFPAGVVPTHALHVVGLELVVIRPPVL